MIWIQNLMGADGAPTELEVEATLAVGSFGRELLLGSRYPLCVLSGLGRVRFHVISNIQVSNLIEVKCSVHFPNQVLNPCPQG